MNEQETRIDLPPESSPSTQWLKVAVIALIIAACFGFGYAWMEHRSAQDMAASRDELRSSLSQTRSQLDALATKLNDINAAQAAAQSAGSGEASTPAAGQPQGAVAKHKTAKHRAGRAEDPRLRKMQAELDAQQKAIADHQKQIQETQDNLTKTRSDLEDSLKSSHDELSGGIAKNHDELVELRKKGERNYYEFDINKSKRFKSVGPLGIALRKSNSKHQFVDLEMVVNDSQLAKKHINLYEPVLFYPEGYSAPVELIVNKIGRDSVHGYVSEPKYKLSEAAASNANNNNTSQQTQQTTSAAQPAADQKSSDIALQHRSEPQQ